jgi:hypothetical protein
VSAPVLVRPARGICECGCGQPTTIAPKTSRRDGRIAGEPARFVAGHNASAAAAARARTAKQRQDPPAKAAPGVQRCKCCPYPLVSSNHRGPAPTGWRRHRARGLCDSCHAAAERDGTLVDFEYQTRRRDALLADWEVLRLSGLGRRAAAQRLGMNLRDFERALTRARDAGDPRAVMGDR